MHRWKRVPRRMWCMYPSLSGCTEQSTDTHGEEHADGGSDSICVTGSPEADPGRCWAEQGRVPAVVTRLVSDEPRQDVHARARLRDHLGGVDDIGRVLQWASSPSEEAQTLRVNHSSLFNWVFFYQTRCKTTQLNKAITHTQVTAVKSPHSCFNVPQFVLFGIKRMQKHHTDVTVSSYWKYNPCHIPILRNFLGSLLFPELYEIPFYSMNFLVICSKEVLLSVFWESLWISGQKNSGVGLVVVLKI